MQLNFDKMQFFKTLNEYQYTYLVFISVRKKFSIILLFFLLIKDQTNK